MALAWHQDLTEQQAVLEPSVQIQRSSSSQFFDFLRISAKYNA